MITDAAIAIDKSKRVKTRYAFSISLPEQQCKCIIQLSAVFHSLSQTLCPLQIFPQTRSSVVLWPCLFLPLGIVFGGLSVLTFASISVVLGNHNNQIMQ